MAMGWKSAVVLACLPMLGACAPLGPRALQASRPLYNEAVASTNDQELLLNLVRIRYRDTTPISRRSSASPRRWK
jgi:hypothetical protein